jgi:predicted MFS family arabinose efflux permease
MEAIMNRWSILALLFVARTGLGVQFQTVGSVSDEISRTLGIDYAQVGTLIGLFLLPGLFLSLPIGFMGRQVSDRILVCCGLGALALGSALVTAADGFAAVAAGRLICGAGFVFATIFLSKMIADWFAGKEIATAMSVLVMSWPFGIAFAQVANGWIAEAFGWRAVFHVASLFCLASLALVLLLYRAPPAVSPSGSRPTRYPGWRELRLVTLAAMVWAAFNAAYVIYLAFAPLLLRHLGFGPIDSAFVVSLASWVLIASGPVCGQLADRSGRPDLVLYTSLLVAVAVLLLLPHGLPPASLCLALGLVGMAPAGLIMALSSDALRPENRAFGMGIFFSWYFLMTAPAPIIAGWLYDMSGDARWPIYLAALLFAAAAAFNAAFRWVQHREPTADRVLASKPMA